MNFRDYLRVLRRGWLIVLAVTVLGTAGGVLLTLTTTKVYQANVQVFVATSNSSDPTQLAQGNTFTQDRVQSYTTIATAPAVTGPVIAQLGLHMSQDDLASKISADAPLNKVLINLHVTDHDAATAAQLANAVADKFAVAVENFEQTDVTGKSVVKVTVVHPATKPTTPIKPAPVLNIGLGFIAGLLIGMGVVFLRDLLDNTIKSAQDFDALGVPVLASVPFDKRTANVPIAFRGDPHSLRSEAFRQLRINLQFVNVDEVPRVIAVTSAIPGEGKTTTALNLAAALAEGGYTVCLVEADLRRPTIASTLGLVPDVGFTTVIVGTTAIENAMQTAGRNLAVLTSGPIPPNPSELLMTVQAKSVIRTLADKVDYVIIDTAPLLPVSDGAEVAALADATVLVHRAGKTTRQQVMQSVEALEKVGERPVGVVLNMITRRGGRYDYEYNYYYSYRPDRTRSASSRKAYDEQRNRAVASARHSIEQEQSQGQNR